jgi:hypothetical protein
VLPVQQHQQVAAVRILRMQALPAPLLLLLLLLPGLGLAHQLV